VAMHAALQRESEEHTSLSRSEGRGVATDEPVLTVLVPVFNEAATIDELLRRVVKAPYTKQIVVVDDGSTDGTATILERWTDHPSIEVYRHARNRGKGRAIRTALQHAQGRFIIIQDADLETDPADYALLIEPLVNQEVDLVLGSRFLPHCCRSVCSLSPFRLGVRLLNVVVWILYRVRITDEACCYKACATKTLQSMQLECEGFELCPEVVAKASRLGLQFQEVAIRYCPRDARAGKKLRYRDGLCALWWLWKLRSWTPSMECATLPGPSVANDVRTVEDR
jgi:glycosyltransferase involved in cell wall biosynthesis